MQEAGYETHVCYSANEAINVIEKYIGIKKESMKNE